jgi:hypothetical protein
MQFHKEQSTGADELKLLHPATVWTITWMSLEAGRRPKMPACLHPLPKKMSKKINIRDTN